MFELVGRDGLPAVFDHDLCLVPLRLRKQEDLRPGVAVVDCIADQVVKRPRKLVRIAHDLDIRRDRKPPLPLPLREDRRKFAGELLEHAAQIDLFPVQSQRRQVKARNVKKFVDKLLQTLRFPERDVRVAAAKLLRDLRLIAEQREIPDHAGQRRLQVVCQIHDQVILALFGKLRVTLSLLQGMLDGIDLPLCRCKLLRKSDIARIFRDQRVDAAVDLYKISDKAVEIDHLRDDKDEHHTRQEIQAEMIAHHLPVP